MESKKSNGNNNHSPFFQSQIKKSSKTISSTSKSSASSSSGGNQSSSPLYKPPKLATQGVASSKNEINSSYFQAKPLKKNMTSITNPSSEVAPSNELDDSVDKSVATPISEVYGEDKSDLDDIQSEHGSVTMSSPEDGRRENLEPQQSEEVEESPPEVEDDFLIKKVEKPPITNTRAAVNVFKSSMNSRTTDQPKSSDHAQQPPVESSRDLNSQLHSEGRNSSSTAAALKVFQESLHPHTVSKNIEQEADGVNNIDSIDSESPLCERTNDDQSVTSKKRESESDNSDPEQEEVDNVYNPESEETEAIISNVIHSDEPSNLVTEKATYKSPKTNPENIFHRVSNHPDTKNPIATLVVR